jgi:hypothetical protein
MPHYNPSYVSIVNTTGPLVVLGRVEGARVMRVEREVVTETPSENVPSVPGFRPRFPLWQAEPRGLQPESLPWLSPREFYTQSSPLAGLLQCEELVWGFGRVKGKDELEEST